MPQHILVVDDDPLFVSCIARQLKVAGYRIGSVTDGLHCEQYAGTEHPDLILLDMHMPGRSGLETLDLLRSREDTCRIPVVMLSGADDDFDAARRAGAAGVMLKPFRQAELLNTVRNALNTYGASKISVGPARQVELAGD
jgi:CheY-like chemotaxis protein